MYRYRIVKLTPSARFSTLCLHAGQEPDPSTGAIITPIYQTSTYVQDELGKHKGYEYARTQNPTREALERNIAAIEGGAEGFAFASGMAAIGAIATLLKSGDHVVVSDNTYGGTFRLFEQVLTRYQLSFSYVDTSALDRVEAAITPATADARRRQHVCQPVRATPTRDWGSPGRPQHNQVLKRSQRQRRWRDC